MSDLSAGAQPATESIVCMTYPDCDREHAGGAGGVPVHPPKGSQISGDEPLIPDMPPAGAQPPIPNMQDQPHYHGPEGCEQCERIGARMAVPAGYEVLPTALVDAVLDAGNGPTTEAWALAAADARAAIRDYRAGQS